MDKEKEVPKEPIQNQFSSLQEIEIEVEEEADIELSLCGDQISGGSEDDLMPIFMKHKISFTKFIKDPISIISNPNLMVKIEDKLYDWKLACPLIVSLLAFKKVFLFAIFLNGLASA